MTQIFVGLDGEMTGARGLMAFRDYQLIQIGLATGKRILHSFVSDIGFQEWKEVPEAMSVNGFTADRIRAGPAPEKVDESALAFLNEQFGKEERNLHAVGWNVGSFDMPFVREYLPKLASKFSYRSVDLNSIVFALSDSRNDYERIKKASKKYAEDELGEARWHDAEYDAMAALLSFEYLRSSLRAPPIRRAIAPQRD